MRWHTLDAIEGKQATHLSEYVLKSFQQKSSPLRVSGVQFDLKKFSYRVLGQ